MLPSYLVLMELRCIALEVQTSRQQVEVGGGGGKVFLLLLLLSGGGVLAQLRPRAGSRSQVSEPRWRLLDCRGHAAAGRQVPGGGV